MNWRAVGIGVAGCSAVGLLCACCIAAGVGYFVVAGRSPENIVVEIDSPFTVPAGESFIITVDISNTGQVTQTLFELSLSKTYLQGIFVLRTRPQYDTTGSLIDETYFDFREPLAPGSRSTIQIFAVASEAGSYDGILSLCINSDISCFKRGIRTVVK